MRRRYTFRMSGPPRRPTSSDAADCEGTVDASARASIYGAVQNFMLAGRALGIGSVLTTFNRYIEETLRRELGLPEEVVPACVIPVGYPDGQRFGPTTRRPAESVTYWDAWGSSKTRAANRGPGG